MHNRNVNNPLGQLPLFSTTEAKSIVHKVGLFNQIISIDNLFNAWSKFSKGKRKKTDVMEFEFNLEDNLFELAESLVTKTYKHGIYERFVIHDPKRRVIHKARVRDRIVHQALVNIVEPIFDQRFIYDSYSCRINKGSHRAVKRLHYWINKIGQNHTKTVYALKCDIKLFFASVHHDLLLKLFSRWIQDTDTLWLARVIIDSFHVSHSKGVPLGNVTSQLFANVYLNEFDRFVKHSLREKYYMRYCDDFLILHRSRDYLVGLISSIQNFLENELGLSLHGKKIIIRTPSQGIDFLGYVVLEYATVLRSKTKKRMIRKVNYGNLPSYLGLCSHADAYEVGQHIKNMAGV